MTTLSPKLAVELSQDIYTAVESQGMIGFSVAHGKSLDVKKSTQVKGTTGGLVIVKKQYGMAILAKGVGDFNRDAFLIFKGTVAFTDWLTDANAGVITGRTGTKIHQGFHYCFNSMFSEIQKFTSNLQGVDTLHCVGHSLGGALATLTADWLCVSQKRAAKLYTFGSPRTGLEFFAQRLTSTLGAENIYRVVNSTDPVPFVPTWPFYHAPNTSAEYRMTTPYHPFNYHKIGSYAEKIKSYSSWEVLRIGTTLPPQTTAIENFLNSDGFISLTTTTIELINAAFIYVLKKSGHGAAVGVNIAFASWFTVMDRLAYVIEKSIDVLAKAGNWAFRLIKRIGDAIGMKIVEGTKFTLTFLRNLFMRLHQRV